MKSILIIGMGKFGRHLAGKLAELKNDVMIVDRNENIIDELANGFTDAHIGDCTNPAVLKSLDIPQFDICFVAIGENFQSSLEITSLLKDLGAKYVVSKAHSEIQAKFLLRNGADEVAYPERDAAEKLAVKHNAENIFDYIELTPEFSICEIPIMKSWIGESIISLNVRSKYNLNILAIKKADKLQPMPPPDYIFCENDHIVVVGKPSDIFKLTSKI